MSAERHCKDTTGEGVARERKERGVREKGRGDENDASERRSVDGIKKDAAVNTRVMHSRKRGLKVPPYLSISLSIGALLRCFTATQVFALPPVESLGKRTYERQGRADERKVVNFGSGWRCPEIGGLVLSAPDHAGERK